MTNALAQAGRKHLDPRMTYTEITKQMILSRTKIAWKHQFLSRCPSLRPKQEDKNLRKTRAKSFMGRTRLATFPQWYTCRVRPEEDTLHEGAPGADLGGGCRGCAPLPPEMNLSLYSLLKFVYLTGQWRHSLEVHPLLRKILDPPLTIVRRTKQGWFIV